MADLEEAPAQVETEVHDLAARALLSLCGGELVVVEGINRGQRLALGPMPIRVGTALGSHLRLTDPTVSRLHFQLTPRRDVFRLVDAGSTNGTFVEGLRVYDADLAPGSTIRVGATVLRLDARGEPVQVALSQQTSLGSLLGSSVEMRRLYALVERIAPTESTVLIQGETGTGKDLVARELHLHSARAKGPLVAVDCGAIAPTVIESELFGHVAGAFTDARATRRGLIEQADAGTLFLDEIGELPLVLQAKLLRALENREVRPVGSNNAKPVDVRIIAATNRPLANSVNAGSFREDLYYRLAVIEILLPPLRSRREDIPLLAAHFLHLFSGRDAPVPSNLLPLLLARSWPGNVRELRNYIERCCALGFQSGASRSLDAGGVALAEREASTAVLALNLDLPLKEGRDELLERFERFYVERMLKRTDGNVTRAAELAGVSRRFLQRLIVRLGVRGATVEPGEPAVDGDDEFSPDDA